MPILQQYFLYILTNQRNTVFYTGITSNLPRRISEHKIKLENKFTKKYNINKLVYFESFLSKQQAAKREKIIKGWKREKKIKLIKLLNPKFEDLSQKWFITRDPSLR